MFTQNSIKRLSHLPIEELIEAVRNKSNLPTYQFEIKMDTARDGEYFPHVGGLIQCVSSDSTDGGIVLAYLSPNVPNQNKVFGVGTRLITPFTGLYITHDAIPGGTMTFEVSNEFNNIFRYDLNFFPIISYYLQLTSDLLSPYSSGESITDTNTTHTASKSIFVGVTQSYDFYINGAWITFPNCMAGAIYPISAVGARKTAGSASPDAGDIVFLGRA